MSMNRAPTGVFLTYAAAESGDGLGAQAQRLMGLFSAARQYGLGYFHTPIKTIEINPGDPHNSLSDRANYLKRVNELFALPGDITVQPKRTIHMGTLTSSKLTYLKLLHRLARSVGMQILVKLPYSLPWSDQNPDAYSHAAGLLRERIVFEKDAKVFRIDMHIRRAVAPRLGGDGKPYDRYVPTEWYRDVLHQTVTTLEERRIPFKIRIHTDIPRGRWKVPPDTTPGTLDMWRRHNFIDDQGFLVDMSENLNHEFANYGPIEVATGWDPLEAIKSMVTADALIMCASSLSYVAGLMRGTDLTITPTFFHTPMSSWMLVPHGGDEELGTKVAARLLSQ